MIDEIFQFAPFSLKLREKQPLLLKILSQLHNHHRKGCAEYSNLCVALNTPDEFSAMEQFPYLPIRLFKDYSLKSVADNEVFKVLQSSGTSGQKVSQIYLDRKTAQLQIQALSSIVQNFIGRNRLPMIIIDSAGTLKDGRMMNARKAAISGLSTFGRNHFYALDNQMSPDVNGLKKFINEHKDGPILLFGFTFMVWQWFQQLNELKFNINLDQVILFHTGGWKRMQQKAVSSDQFKQSLKNDFGISRIHNFYGLAEQTGSVFVECDEGNLHASLFSDLLIRDFIHLSVNPTNKEGFLQLISVLPHSYPGNSLLTDDVATLLGEDDCNCGRFGKYFRVSGRLPRAELRGCSDVL